MKRYLAELVGTFVLVLFGTGAAVIAGDSLGVLGISFAFGLAIVAMAYSIGSISGAHLNPAVSLAMLLNKRMELKDFLGYFLFQIIGAILGSGIVYYFLSSANLPTTQLGQNLWGALGPSGAFGVELILTTIFIVVIMGVTGKNGTPQLAGLVIGLSLVLIHLLGINLTGTSVNPARSIGPALLVGGDALNQLWVFIAAPLVGGALGAIISKYLFDTEEN